MLRGIEIRGKVDKNVKSILTEECLTFLGELERRFGGIRKNLLQKRLDRQIDINNGILPSFLKDSDCKRATDKNWKCSSVPLEIQDRRVEITGPTDRKMVINALNSGAKVFMADFEDANCPNWENSIHGQQNMIDANNRTISFTSAEGRKYELNKQVAVLFVRPRGWHLNEDHLAIDGLSMSGSLFDFGCYIFHNHQILKNRNSNPYFYLPKMESHLEARLWNDVFVFSQNYLGMPIGTIKATVLIETILASFEMDEILYELRDHSAGLNCGRWDYIFSFIKKFQSYPDKMLPDRAKVTMTSPFMDSYVKLLIYTCHKRGVHAMGGMAAQIPIKNNEQANNAAMEKVRLDKQREVRAGHDGTWVAHPALIPIAMEQFNTHMKSQNQISYIPSSTAPNFEEIAKSLLSVDPVKPGDITEDGFRSNIVVGILYLEAWLNGNGCVPIHNLMEDAATAEISRSQIWQWIKHKAPLPDGKSFVTLQYYNRIFKEESDKLEKAHPNSKTLTDAIQIFNNLIVSPNFIDFLTPSCYKFVVDSERKTFSPKL
ncbi:malate synthase [Dictyostelium discoideum AX4]|uniref:Malate synthase n=1 Tax=Dictyostelium discoideum TaxID=44689 RepID=MASY_DICDI|nr:malate synthase [Dictyostelium discoideum AX4]Q8T2K9.2 RecName: Full=Malate synthase [Dictyostelium discoideum]EAL69694.2 malate synthase [Dictyostelium discoideum AX4]|eukprot:XP_643552.2 malate synthase [Dictyostelium discoideum AX4]